MRKQEETKTLNNLIKYIILFNIIALIVGVVLGFVFKLKFIMIFFYVLGLILGALIACLWASDINKSVRVGLEKDEEGAAKYMRKRSIIRMIIIMALIITGAYFSLNMIVGVMIGLISLKLSAYIQIFVNKTNE